MMAKLDLEMTTAGRIMTLNTSLSDNRIKTMVSQTENVMIDEITEKIALR